MFSVTNNTKNVIVLSIVIVKPRFHVCLTVGLKWVEEECNKFF